LIAVTPHPPSECSGSVGPLGRHGGERKRTKTLDAALDHLGGDERSANLPN
jgi:hypothetical protein